MTASGIRFPAGGGARHPIESLNAKIMTEAKSRVKIQNWLTGQARHSLIPSMYSILSSTVKKSIISHFLISIESGISSLLNFVRSCNFFKYTLSTKFFLFFLETSVMQIVDLLLLFLLFLRLCSCF